MGKGARSSGCLRTFGLLLPKPYVHDEGYYLHDEGYYVHDEGYYVHDEGYYVHDEGYYVHDEGYYVHDEGYYRNALNALILISTSFLCV
jgi:hypothetical protein